MTDPRADLERRVRAAHMLMMEAEEIHEHERTSRSRAAFGVALNRYLDLKNEYCDATGVRWIPPDPRTARDRVAGAFSVAEDVAREVGAPVMFVKGAKLATLGVMRLFRGRKKS